MFSHIGEVHQRPGGADHRFDPAPGPHGTDGYEARHETRGLPAAQGGARIFHWDGWGIV